VILPLLPHEPWAPYKARWEWLRSRNICLGHVPVAVRQGQRRDAAATGEERHGRCSAGKSRYIRLYLYSVKLALAPMRLGRARVACRSFAAGAQPLTHIFTVGAYGKKKLGMGIRRLCRGEGVCRHAWGDGAHCLSGRHGANYRSRNAHVGLKSSSNISNFRGLCCSRTAVTRDHQSATTESHNFTLSVACPQFFDFSTSTSEIYLADELLLNSNPP
jgi:hypothetical protein